jgi:hypothetical protein
LLLRDEDLPLGAFDIVFLGVIAWLASCILCRARSLEEDGSQTELLVKTKEASFLKKKQTHFNGFKTMSKSNP